MRDVLVAMMKRLTRVITGLEDLELEITQLRDMLGKVLEERLDGADQRRPSRGWMTPEEKVLQKKACAGVSGLSMDWQLDGSAELRIEGGQPFRLRRQLAELLEVLAAPGGRPAGDDLVGWRTNAEIADALGLDRGRGEPQHLVAHAIYKLRLALKAAEQNWFLVHSDGRGSYRFGVRADAAQPSRVVASRATGGDRG